MKGGGGGGDGERVTEYKARDRNRWKVKKRRFEQSEKKINGLSARKIYNVKTNPKNNYLQICS